MPEYCYKSVNAKYLRPKVQPKEPDAIGKYSEDAEGKALSPKYKRSLLLALRTLRKTKLLLMIRFVWLLTVTEEFVEARITEIFCFMIIMQIKKSINFCCLGISLECKSGATGLLQICYA